MKDKDKLAYKKKKRKKNPNFVRQDTHKKKRLAKTWRRPRGEHSKQRLRMQNQPIVSPGYGTPKELRGKHFSGLEIVHINSEDEIKGIDPKTQGVIVSSRLGLRKKLPLLKKLADKKITVLNIPEVEKYLKRKEESLKKKKKKEKKSKKKDKKPKEKKTERKDKKTIEDKVDEDQKKKTEKKEIDKLLTKKR